MIRLAGEVGDALHEERAVVALETTLVAHGFPRGEGVEVALASERAVRDGGAVPATIGLLDGVVMVGLSEADLRRFDASARKVGPRDLAAAEVQRAGSAYVNALSSLAAVAANADPKNTHAVQQGREVAVNALTAAADQLVRLAPNDPLSARILQAMDEEARRDTTSAQSRLAWF